MEQRKDHQHIEKKASKYKHRQTEQGKALNKALGQPLLYPQNNSTAQWFAEGFLPLQAPGSSPLFAITAPDAQAPFLALALFSKGGRLAWLGLPGPLLLGIQLPKGQAQKNHLETACQQKAAPTNVQLRRTTLLQHSHRKVSPAIIP